jgi:hypothetical protein
MHFSEIADATVSHRFASRGKARHSDRAQSSAAAKAMRQESASEPGAGDEPSGATSTGHRRDAGAEGGTPFGASRLRSSGAGQRAP